MKQESAFPDRAGSLSPKARLAVATSLLAATAVLAGLLAGCRLLGDHVKDRTPKGCGDCHADITRQWAASSHAHAWNDPAFLRATDQHMRSGCLPCHAPEPLLEKPPGTSPVLRAHRQFDGVDCNTCHAVGCGYAGRHDSWGPHEMVQDTTRLPCSSFCGTCHVVEQEEYADLYVPSVRPSRSPRQCAGCHMPACRDRLTQGHVLSLLHPKRAVHDHSFPAFPAAVVRGAVAVSEIAVLQRPGDAVQVQFTLANRGAGHRIPTGKFGHREVRICVEMLDSERTLLGSAETSLLRSRNEGLEPGRPTPFSLRVDLEEAASPATVRIRVDRLDEDGNVLANFATHETLLPRD